MSHKIICTAGHIDHGKTSLVKALTGTDTDRLAEEKERGITIDLGFAFYGDQVTIIDLPGHERFIRNMVAGAITVDFALLIIAADDGPMPQTREHLDILQLLGINKGMTIVTKADLVDQSWLDLMVEEIKEFLVGSFLESEPILIVDSVSGRGMEEFVKTFNQALLALPVRKSRTEFREPIDRSFTIKGYGTIITGTVISGKVGVKDAVELLPKRKIVKVRGIQIHGRTVSAAQTGDRAALNLSGVEKWEIERGDVLAEPGLLNPTDNFYCQTQLLTSCEPLKHRQRLRFHLGTAEVIGRILLLESNILQSGETAMAQLELEQPTVALRGDRFVFRTYSPQITIGGGVILLPLTEKPKSRARAPLELLKVLYQGDEEEITYTLIKTKAGYGITDRELISLGGISKIHIDTIAEGLIAKGKIRELKSGDQNCYISEEAMKDNLLWIISTAKEFHKKYSTKSGFTLTDLNIELSFPPKNPFLEYSVEEALKVGKLVQKGSVFALPDHKIELTSEQQFLAEKILKTLTASGLSAPKAHPIADELKVDVDVVFEMLTILESMEKIVRLERDTVITLEVFNETVEKLKQLYHQVGTIRLPEAVKFLGTGRRITVSLLQYLDKIGITERIGDERRFKE